MPLEGIVDFFTVLFDAEDSVLVGSMTFDELATDGGTTTVFTGRANAAYHHEYQLTVTLAVMMLEQIQKEHSPLY